MNNLRILVSGGGLAGLTAAHFLAKAGARVTVIERSPVLRAAGQGVDFAGAARRVLDQMGILSLVKTSSTSEKGTHVVDSDDTRRASFPVPDPPPEGSYTEQGSGFSPTNEIEISRGKLVDIMYRKAKENDGIQWMFGSRVTSLNQDDGAGVVTVSFKGEEDGSSPPTGTFDLVVGADGMGSRMRTMTFGSEVSSASVKPVDQHTAYFTIPWTPQDGQWSRIHPLPQRRFQWIRPLGDTSLVSAYLAITTHKNPSLAARLRAARTQTDQKRLLRELFADGGWETERILDGMDKGSDFYLQEVAQIKLPTWSSGRVVLVGDAAYCPSPLSGMGSSVAVLGARALAGEISRTPDDIAGALKRYEDVMRPHLEDVQKLAWGVPWIVTPKTRLGVEILKTIFGLVSWGITTRLGKWATKGGDPQAREFELPDYADQKDEKHPTSIERR
ncbi:hypothetical protein HKX48_006776 [Thoreauomyces humboldtii]|nr:hypothetical protein HKX48_006776 [Thoreauomyces humboldtii]